MGRLARILVGATQVVVGLGIALFPLLSVQRLTGQALDELPIIPDAEATDTRNPLGALLDDDYVLATRSYTGVEAEPIRSRLVAAGFEAMVVNGELWLAKPCCGNDELRVRVDEPDLNGRVVATLTEADDDIRTAARLFVIIGLALFVPGLLIGMSGLIRPRDRAEVPASKDVTGPIQVSSLVSADDT
jgi:hypothetical protein